MNRKQLVIILITLAVLGGAGLLLLNSDKADWHETPGKQGQKFLPNFPINDVAAIKIKDQSEINLVKKDDLWTVQESGGYPANFKEISDFLFKLNDLKITQSEPIGASQLPRMELGEPGSAPKAATLVELKDNKGAVLAAFLLGKRHSRASGDINSLRDLSDGRYAILRNDTKNLLLLPDAFMGIDPKLATWQAKEFFSVEKPRTISLVSTNTTNSWKIDRATETGDWTLAEAKPAEVLDKNKVSSLTSALTTLSFMDIATNADTGLDHPKVVTIETFDHVTYTIKLGGQTPEGNTYLSYALTADLPKERTAGKDEKPEDKAKLDKEFQDKTKQLQEKIDREKRGEKWTYVMASWAEETLAHDRAQLLAEKKEEPKAENNTAAPVTLP